MSDRQPIIRRPGPLRFEGITASTLKSLQAFACDRALELDSEAVFADLSLGAWQGHAAAADMALQLGIPWQTTSADTLQPFTSSARIIARMIDNEALGNEGIIRALDLAGRIRSAAGAAGIRCFMILVPLPGISWQQQDIAFLSFLRHGGDDVLLVKTTPFADLPPGWCCNWTDAPGIAASPEEGDDLAIVPGIIAPAFAATLTRCSSGLSVRQGAFLIAPEHRRSPAAIPRSRFDRLAGVSNGWIGAYAQVHGTPYFVDPVVLCREASIRFGEGATDIALRLLQSAEARSESPAARAAVQSVAQGIRIASGRFSDAAALPAPPSSLPSEFRASLTLSKAWGLVMCDQPVIADRYLSEAARMLHGRAETIEYLYLMNITALNHFKAKDPSGALELEKNIERRLAAQPVTDWQMAYINHINQARLYRSIGDRAAAAHHYARAFLTCEGLRSETDRVYANVCLATVESRGGDQASAFAAWLRAAFHWLSLTVPEALNSRTVRAITGRSVPSEEVVEQVSAALARSLRSAAQTLGVTPRPRDGFRFSQPSSDLSVETAISGLGWGLLTSRNATPPVYDGGRYNELVAIAVGFALDGIDYPAATATLVVDDAFGRELPVTLAQSVESALRWGAETIAAAGQLITIDPTRKRELERALIVQISQGVAAFETVGNRNAVVHFKRYRSPLTLPEYETAVLRSASDGSTTVGALTAQFADVLTILRDLERLRVVRLSLPETAIHQSVSNTVG